MYLVKFIILVLSVSFFGTGMTATNYCTISVQNVRCENTTLRELDLLVNTYKSKILNLSLKHSDIKNINKNSFAGFDALVDLNLVSNNLKNISVGAFNGLQNLRKLSLKNNSLSALNLGIFNGLNSLQYLNLDNNFINYVSYKYFYSLNALKMLSLSHNKLSVIYSDAFSEISTIKLNLSYNEVVHIEENAFGHKPNSIKNLDLSHNKISTIGPNIFKICVNLERLNLASNQLEKMDFAEQLSSVRHLDLSYNKITALNEIKLRNLEVLDLTNNLIKTIDVEFVKVLPNLHELYLRRNRMDCRWFTENYDKIPSTVMFQSYELVTIPQSVGGKRLVYECSTRFDGVPSMILVKGTQGLNAAGSSNESSEAKRDANEFGFFEIYFWLTLGAALVYTTTAFCRNCLEQSEDKQKNMEKSKVI